MGVIHDCSDTILNPKAQPRYDEEISPVAVGFQVASAELARLAQQNLNMQEQLSPADARAAVQMAKPLHGAAVQETQGPDNGKAASVAAVERLTASATQEVMAVIEAMRQVSNGGAGQPAPGQSDKGRGDGSSNDDAVKPGPGENTPPAENGWVAKIVAEQRQTSQTKSWTDTVGQRNTDISPQAIRSQTYDVGQLTPQIGDWANAVGQPQRSAGRTMG